jgi:hypothetical protein
MLVGIALVAGCAHKIDRFARESACQDEVTTPSVEAARAVQTQAAVRRRPHTTVRVQAKEGAVTHAPLYFEDPYEEAQSEECCVVWSAADYLHSWLYGPARCLVNTVLFPISVGATPPWVTMASDGQPSRSVVGIKHDARRWTEQRTSSPLVK